MIIFLVYWNWARGSATVKNAEEGNWSMDNIGTLEDNILIILRDGEYIEGEAALLYSELSNKASDPLVKTVFQIIYHDSLKHKDVLSLIEDLLINTVKMHVNIESVISQRRNLDTMVAQMIDIIRDVRNSVRGSITIKELSNIADKLERLEDIEETQLTSYEFLSSAISKSMDPRVQVTQVLIQNIINDEKTHKDLLEKIIQIT